MRRPPSPPPQVELPITLVALAAAAAALVEALIALLVHTTQVHPHWARSVAAGVLALAALLALGIGRLRTGPPAIRQVQVLALTTSVLALAAAGVAIAAGVTNG